MAEYTFLTEAMESLMRYYSIPGCAIAVIHGGNRHMFSFGFRNIETKEPFTPDTINSIGSCTKSMTAYAIMRLAERGLVDIDEPVSRYVPEFTLYDATASRQVTLRDMLCHRTGLGGHDGTWPDNGISRSQFLKRLRYMEPNAPFRAVAQYSNVMYAAVGGITEVITGKLWEDILREEIFEPLGMTRTYCLMDEAAAQDNCAMPHWWNNGLQVIPRWNIDMAGPCGSIMSTAADMSQWLSFHIQGGQWQGKRLLSTDSFAMMHTPQIAMEYPHLQGGRSLGYGLGWRVLDYHGHVVQQHTGKIEGYSAFQFYEESTGSGAVFLQNLHAPDNPFIFAIQGLLLDYFLDRPAFDWAGYYMPGGEHAPEDMYHTLEFDCMPERAVAGTKPTHELSAYVGTYYNEAYGTFCIGLNGENLELSERDVRHLPMSHFQYDTFKVEHVKEDTDLYTIPLTFFDEPQGRVGGFALRMEPKVSDIIFKKYK
jgi:CubicO group peptidase (beta-lactamase class C family)